MPKRRKPTLVPAAGTQNDSGQRHVTLTGPQLLKTLERVARARGGQYGNQNAVKGISLPDGVKLDSVESILKFMREVLVPSTLEGRIGTRQSSAIATCCKVLLDYDKDLRDLEIVKKRLDVLEEQDRHMEATIQEITSKRHLSITG